MAQPCNEALVVRKADLSDLDDIVPLFDSYRLFYGQQTDLQSCRSFIEARLKENDSIILIALAVIVRLDLDSCILRIRRWRCDAFGY